MSRAASIFDQWNCEASSRKMQVEWNEKKWGGGEEWLANGQYYAFFAAPHTHTPNYAHVSLTTPLARHYFCNPPVTSPNYSYFLVTLRSDTFLISFSTQPPSSAAAQTNGAFIDNNAIIAFCALSLGTTTTTLSCFARTDERVNWFQWEFHKTVFVVISYLHLIIKKKLHFIDKLIKVFLVCLWK